jgi:DNA-binding MarR family transcriptional regulator
VIDDPRYAGGVSTRGSRAPKPKTPSGKAAPTRARGAPAIARVDIDPAELAAKKQASPVQLLFRVARRLNERALARVEATTGLALRPSHTALFPHVDLEGTRPTELARRLGVTKQAVHPLVEELVTMGVLERTPDPRDARATLVRFSTRKGRTLLDGLATLAAVDRELGELLGAPRLEALRTALIEVDAWLDERASAGPGGG